MEDRDMVTIKPVLDENERKTGYDIFVCDEWQERVERRIDANRIAATLRAKRLTCPITNLAHEPGYYCDACGDIAADNAR
jgi:hypothetical protein